MRIYMLGAKGIPASTMLGGGVERHVEEIAVRLAARGHHVCVYMRSYAWNRGLKRYRGVHIIPLPCLHTKNLAAITHTFLATLHVLFQPADVIHYHGVGPSTLAWMPRVFKWRAKVVSTFHSQDRFDPKWSWFARAYLAYGEWCSVNFPHVTIVVSHVLQVFCRKMYGKETVYIPNGTTIPRAQATDAVKTFGLKPGEYFLTVGRLVPKKAIDLALEAYRSVDTPFPFVVVGDAEFADSYIDTLQRLAAQDSRVRLLGYQSGKPLAQLLAHCYAFVHPSRSEGLPLVVLEAMANGKLVILSDIPEHLELIDHSGIAFKADNRRSLQRTLEGVLQDPLMVRERGERGREVVRRLYSWDSVVDRLETVYRQLVG